jgi:hypothetical protein
MKLSVSSLMSWTPMPLQSGSKVSRETYAARVVDLDDEDTPTIVIPPTRSTARRRMTEVRPE